MGKSKTPAVPQLSAEERDLLNKQGQTLDNLNSILQSENLGSKEAQSVLRQFTGLYNEDGSLNQEAVNSLRDRALATQQIEAGIGDQALNQLGNIFSQDQLSQLSDQIGVQEAQRLLGALQGNEPSAALREEERRAFEQLKESAGQRGIRIEGNDLFNATSQSTAGNQLLADLRRNAETRRDLDRRAIIDQGTSANLNRLGFGLQNRTFGFNAAQALRPDVYGQTAQQLGGAQSIGPSSLLGLGLGISQGYGQAAQPYQQQRYLQYQRDIQNSANRQGLTNSLIGLGGTLGGAFLAGPIGGAIGRNIASSGANTLSPAVQPSMGFGYNPLFSSRFGA